MKYSIFISFFIFAVGCSTADSKLALCDNGISNSVNISAFSYDEVNRRGCCSHHNGACGCQNGRAKCCDGTLSPSCGCN